jgi:antibiotic biosynthesis monooxygenase (ABM) superfamily enzyme
MSEGPVTYIITRRVKAAHQAEFENWLTGINQAALTFTGHLGANVIRQTDAAIREYVIIWRFDSYANLKQWEDSPVRREWLNKSWHLAEGAPDIQKLTGLEFWFTIPPGSKPAPPKYKMAVVVTLALYPLVLLLHVLLGPFIEFLPVAIQTMITVVIAVLIMTFCLMPFMTRLLARWLDPAS